MSVEQPVTQGTVAELLTVQSGGRDRTFPVGKIGSVGTRFCDLLLDDPDGELPHRAVVFSCTDDGWVVSNVCDRYVVLHTGGETHLTLAPGGKATLTGVPFILSVPGRATAAEVLVSFGADSRVLVDPAVVPWLEPSDDPDVFAAPDVGTAPSRRRRPRRLVGVVAVLTLFVAAAGAVLLTSGSDPAPAVAPPPHPRAWDPRLTDLVAFVEKDRELPFKQPVFVDFLPNDAFEDKAGGGDAEPSAEERREMAQFLGLLRATGLIEGDVDLLDRMSQLHSENTLAYYDSKTERITVRGTELTEAVRVTLVHELTHVLQDQHFDLGRIEHMEGDWLRYVGEGDATRVEMHWANQLSPEARAAYEAESAQESDAADLEGIPEILMVMSGAPYQFGLEFVEALAALGGNPAVDRALQNPPVSDEQIFDPFRYVARDVPVPVEPPILRRGEEWIGGDTSFGSISLYVMLAQRIDERQAMKAVDGWGGDTYLDYETHDGRACTRVTLRGDTQADTDELAQALDAWAQTMPAGAASTSTGDGLVSFQACDPGPDFKMGEPRLQEALGRPISRTLMATGFVGDGAGSEEARCLAGAVIDEFGPEIMYSERGPNAAQLRRIGEMGAACRH